MKNIKLLLATTAILSMGAMVVNAGTTGADVTIHPQVTMVSDFGITSVQELNFGKVAWGTSGKSLTITASADENKDIATDIEGSAIYFGGANAGIIVIGGPAQSPYYGKNYELSFPTEIILSTTVGEGDEATDVECGRVSNFNQASVRQGGSMGSIAYGGTYTIAQIPSNQLYSSSHNCTGAGIVTFILPTD